MAVYQALQAASTGNLKTRTVHSEVLLALHPSNNVSLRKQVETEQQCTDCDT
jgi:hypothetical protein